MTYIDLLFYYLGWANGSFHDLLTDIATLGALFIYPTYSAYTFIKGYYKVGGAIWRTILFMAVGILSISFIIIGLANTFFA